MISRFDCQPTTETPLFWRLSPELRNEIYDLASSTIGGVFVELTKRYPEGYEWKLKARTCYSHPLALTEVSKEIRVETLGAFYAVNNVSLILPMLDVKRSKACLISPSPDYFAAKVKSWLHALPPKARSSLKTIELDIGTWLNSGRQNRPFVLRLAAALYDLATAFHEENVTATVWISLAAVGPWCFQQVLPLSFKLSAFDVADLRRSQDAVIKRELARMTDIHHAGALSSMSGVHSDLQRYSKQLSLLADVLEAKMD